MNAKDSNNTVLEIKSSRTPYLDTVTPLSLQHAFIPFMLQNRTHTARLQPSRPPHLYTCNMSPNLQTFSPLCPRSFVGLQYASRTPTMFATYFLSFLFHGGVPCG